MNLTLKTKLVSRIGSSAMGLLVLAALSFATLRIVELNGSLYKEVKLGQDIIADYVAPAEHTTENRRLAASAGQGSTAMRQLATQVVKGKQQVGYGIDSHSDRR